MKDTKDPLLTIGTVKGTQIGPGSLSRLGTSYRLWHFWLDDGGQKEQVRNVYLPFYRVRDNTVTSLWPPYDVTGDVPNTSLAVPGNVGKRLNCSQGSQRQKMVGLRLLRREALATVRVQKG